jgi:hypothetical protein
MKNISDFIGTLCILFIVGALVYGGFEEGHAMQTILILGAVILIIYLISIREDNIAKTNKQKQEKESRKKFDEHFENFKHKLYHYAYNNERISRVTFDIEEGGEYLTEYDETIRNRIDNILKQHISFPTSDFEQFLQKIHEAKLDLPKQPKNKYIGF